MKVALMQPTFLPWLGYFELIAMADVFVILDDFQFSYQSFGQRNRVFVNQDQVGWLTVPVDKKNCYQKPYIEVAIREDIPWRRKTWNAIELNYKKASFFNVYAEAIKSFIVEPQGTLAAQNIAVIRALSEVFGIKGTFAYSSCMSAKGRRSEHVKNLLEEIGADVYLCAHGSFEYMLEDGVFPLKSIDVRFQNAVMRPYSQCGSTKDFVPYLSVIDALFNIGAQATRELIMNATPHWMTWDEMAAEFENRKSTAA